MVGQSVALNQQQRLTCYPKWCSTVQCRDWRRRLCSCAHPWVCSMTSGAIQQGVPTKVLRALGWWPHDALRSMLAATPKSASSTVPSVSTRMLPACTADRECQLTLQQIQ